jgi:hypothetical protein
MAGLNFLPRTHTLTRAERLRLYMSDLEPCQSFSDSEYDDECKHCGWTEYAHASRDAQRPAPASFP